MSRGNYQTPHPSPGVTGNRRYMAIDCQREDGRIRAQEIGNMPGVPAEKCPLLQVGGGTSGAGMQQSGMSHQIIPGTMLLGEVSGATGMDGVISCTIPNEEKGQRNKSKNDHSEKQYTHTADDHENGKYGWHVPVDQLCSTTDIASAERNRNQAGRENNLTAEPYSESRDKCKNTHGRAKPKYAGSTGTGTSGGTGGGAG